MGSIFDGGVGAYQESYIIWPFASKFNYRKLMKEGRVSFDWQDIDNDGEFEIILFTAAGDWDSPCKWAWWPSIYHLNMGIGLLKEMRGENYPSFYAEHAKGLRSNFEGAAGRACETEFRRLIDRAEGLSRGKPQGSSGRTSPSA